MEPPLRVVLEVVRTRAFAVAIDWPGWTRGARDADAALGPVPRAGFADPPWCRLSTWVAGTAEVPG